MSKPAKTELTKKSAVAVLCLAALLACFGAAGVSDISQGARSNAWRKTPCQVTQFEHKSEIVLNARGGTHRRGKFLVSYEYERDGRRFTSTCVNFGEPSIDSPPAGLRQGQESVCYVNPENPADAVLQPGSMPGSWFLAVLGYGCATALAVYAAVAYRRQRGKKADVAAPDQDVSIAA